MIRERRCHNIDTVVSRGVKLSVSSFSFIFIVLVYSSRTEVLFLTGPAQFVRLGDWLNVTDVLIGPISHAGSLLVKWVNRRGGNLA